METPALSSFATDIRLYGRERLATRRIALLCALLVVLSLVAAPDVEAHVLLLRVLTILVLVVQFRLWDDLADQAYDRAHHPERLLIRTPRTLFFWLLLAPLSLASGAMVFLLSGEQGLLAYAALVCLLAAVYAMPLPLLKRRPVRAQLVLLKYPAFLVMTVPCHSCPRLAIASLLAYAALTLHEWLDDQQLRRAISG